MNDIFEPEIFSAGAEIMDEENRKYFQTKCKFEKMFPKYKCCPMLNSIDRTHCSFLINDGYCICDDMTLTDWLELCDDISDEELADMCGVPVDELNRGAEELEKYLGLTD